MRIKKPDYYKTPLKKKSDIANYIADVTDNRAYSRHWHPFCFNVKIPFVNLDFDELLKIYREDCGEPEREDAREFMQRKDYANESWQYVIDRMCNFFIGDVTETDLFNHLWNGKKVAVKYSFEGRCGGWLSINSFEGVDFDDWSWYSDDDRVNNLMEQSYYWLRNFYQLVVMLKHDTRKDALESIFKTYSAEYLFG